MNQNIISQILSDRSQRLFKDLLKALGLVLDLALGNKQQHSLRVSITSVQTGALLGLAGEELRDLFYAGLLHDLGEICLQEEEREMMASDVDPVPDSLRRHPGVGAQICAWIPSLEGTAQLIRQHKERWDGSGYPEGLRGNQISIASQILALVNELDDFVFLTSPRLDQDPRSRLHDIAWRWRGRKVSEEVADAYLEVQQQGAWSTTAFAETHWRSLKLDIVDLAQLIELKEEQFVESILRVLASVIDAKHAYTHGHSWRVAGYGRLIARHAGATESNQLKVYHAGLLHDAGKVAVPQAILDKPGALSGEEWALIREHPRKTHLIVQTIKGMEEVAEIAGSHHERMDGKGYYMGLLADAIPWGARVLAVADTYDAMCSDRAYRKALPHEVAAEELDRFSGKMYDPEIVQVFQKIPKTELEEIRYSELEDIQRF
ncbi:MAG: HD domain-containing protein [Candidatus Sericytochromatia bacterium]|uniref:HD domain-containing protein n=1 Tax=Candidatus Tanganyikabacteria bacterium TaxID=2961651 RepID=A0A937X2K6_9BACT|nr:HD domain-containing protein [Candidatus Tanganyikabacteria bacterium]